MKKYFLSPLFAPIFATLVCSLFINIVYIFMPHMVAEISEEFQFIDIITYVCYGLMLVTFVMLYGDFKDRRVDYFVYLSLGITAMLREMGIQHWLTSTDTTAVKIKFFTNPNNPICEKIIAGLAILLVLCAIAYVAKKYAVYLVKNFFRMDTISWSVGTLIAFGLGGKIVDRFPSNYRAEHGEFLNETIKNGLVLLEETSEVFLPVIAIIILFQYHLIKKDR